jgi:integrase
MAREVEPDIVINGAYVDLFNEFIAYKRALGYSYAQSIQYRICTFSRYLASKPLVPEIVTREYFEEFCARREGERPENQNLRINYTRQFCLFINKKGFDCFVPPDYLCRHDDSFIPRIITEEEMARVIAVADNKQYPRGPKNNKLIYPMLLRMLWCCGMRVGEALSLTLDDVDIVAGILTVRKAKNKSTRLLPMSATCGEYARGYWDDMGFNGGDSSSYFYPSPRGGRFSLNAVHERITSMMTEAGVTIDGSKPPRVHDIRHSFAVGVLSKMINEGIDCYCDFPLLSTYMGHADFSATEYYLRLTEHEFIAIEEAMAPAYLDVYPEVISHG